MQRRLAGPACESQSFGHHCAERGEVCARSGSFQSHQFVGAVGVGNHCQHAAHLCDCVGDRFGVVLAGEPLQDDDLLLDLGRDDGGSDGFLQLRILACGQLRPQPGNPGCRCRSDGLPEVVAAAGQEDQIDIAGQRP